MRCSRSGPSCAFNSSSTAHSDRHLGAPDRRRSASSGRIPGRRPFAVVGGGSARAVVAFLAVFLWVVEPVWAANQTWNGNSGTNLNWSNTANWVGTPVAPPGSTVNKTSTDIATFNGTEAAGNTTVTIDSTTQGIGGITWDLANAKADTIGSLGPNAGNALFLTAGLTTQITSTVTLAETINAPIFLEGGYTFTDVSTSAILNLNGNIALDSAVTGNQVITIGTADAGRITFAGVISNGGASGATLGLTVNGTGAATDVITLAGANTYTGINTLTAGTISLGVAENVGVSGPLGKSAAVNHGNIVMGGGTLQYTTSNQFDYSGRFSTSTANEKYNADINGQNVTWASNLSSATTGTNTVGLTLSSTAGGGTLTLNGVNSFNTAATASTPVITINGGNLQVGNAGALNAAGQGNFATTTMATTNNPTLSINGFGTQANPIIVNGISSGNTATASTAIVQNGAATDAWVAFNNPAITTQFAGTIQDGGAGKLNIVKNGAFNLVLAHANSYTGKTILNGGVVAYFANGAQGNGGPGSLLINANGAFTDNQSGVNPSIPLAALATMLDPASDGGFGLGFNNPDNEALTFG